MTVVRHGHSSAPAESVSMPAEGHVAAACRKADAARRKQRPDPKTELLRRLMEPGVSLDAVWDEINKAARRRHNAAPQATVEALMYSLRERGTKALEEPATRRRLSELSEEQVIEVGDRLLRLKPGIARPWTATEVEQLMQTR